MNRHQAQPPNPFQKKKNLSKLDQFSIATGLIGLAADVISLSGIASASGDKQNFELSLWMIIFFSIIYSVATVNFLARRYFHKKAWKNSLKSQSLTTWWDTEAGIQTTTMWIGIPLIASYTIFALLSLHKSGYIFFGLNQVECFLGSLFIGSGGASLFRYGINESIKKIYTACRISYDEK
jgi:hypothetical protein